MKASVTLRAPAKLNLSLEVLGLQSNGLHALRSVMVPVDLSDEIAISPGGEGLRFHCSDPAIEAGNIVERAFDLLKLPGAEITLQKRIPIGAGMGGGSSDAAAVLLAAQRGTFGRASDLDYLAGAQSLGSDVPFFLVETAALVEGTGERVTALGSAPSWHAVVIKPPVAISTREAYAALDETQRPSRPRNTSVSVALGEALQRADFDRVLSLMQNDFLEIASRTKEIAQALELLRSAGAKKPMLTGSGAAVFALARDRAESEALASRIEMPDNFQLFRCALWSGDAWRR